MKEIVIEHVHSQKRYDEIESLRFGGFLIDVLNRYIGANFRLQMPHLGRTHIGENRSQTLHFEVTTIL